MPHEILIRPERADQADVQTLLAALDRHLASLYPPQAIYILDLQALLAPEVHFLVARADGQAVGTAAFRRMQGEPATGSQPYGEIKRMYVDPAYRGERIAARLLSALESRLRAEGYAQALLETGPEQADAMRLYERCGYTLRPAFGGYPEQGLSVYYGKSLRTL